MAPVNLLIARTAIPMSPKPAFKVYLDHGSSNVNLSGEFVKALVDRGTSKTRGWA